VHKQKPAPAESIDFTSVLKKFFNYTLTDFQLPVIFLMKIQNKKRRHLGGRRKK
jgi:hypothetical protein